MKIYLTSIWHSSQNFKYIIAKAHQAHGQSNLFGENFRMNYEPNTTMDIREIAQTIITTYN